MVDICQQDGYEEHIPEWDDGYVLDIETLKYILMAFKVNQPIYLFGPPGVGKTSIYHQVCAATRRRAIRLQHTANTEESHIVGQWVIKRKTSESGEEYNAMEFDLGPLPQAMLNGWVYIADEYDRTHPQVLSVYQAVLEGKPLYIKEAPEHLRIIRPHPDFRFAATGNTNGSGDDTGLYGATMQQDAATFERFGVVCRVDYLNEKQEVALLRAKTGMSEEHARMIRTFAEKIRSRFPADMSLTIGPRVMINIALNGMLRGSLMKGVESAYANRLPDDERVAALSVAERIMGS